MTPAISLFLLLAFFQTDPEARGVANLNLGDFSAARRELEQAPATPRSAVFLALARAALGECGKAAPELERRFTSEGPPLRRLAGLALAQCQISAKQFAAAGPVIAQL